MRKRSIRKCDVRQAIHYGQELTYDGLLFFALDCDSIPNGRDHILIDELEGVVVILDPDTFLVVTVYRNLNAVANIERRIRYWCQVRRSRKKGVWGVTHH